MPMQRDVRPIPEGYHSITPGLCVKDAAKAIEFYKEALGAKELMRMPGPGGKIMHAELKIGDSIVFVAEESPEMPGSCRSPRTLGNSTVGIFLYVENADAVFAQAVNAGGKARMPLADMFWGDRYGQIEDPFGHQWGIMTHKEDLSPAEMQKRQEEFFAAAAK